MPHKKKEDIPVCVVFNIARAAQYAGVSVHVMTRWLAEDRIVHYDLPGRNGLKRMVKIRKDDLDAFLIKHRRGAA
jgi:hypothetical protein